MNFLVLFNQLIKYQITLINYQDCCLLQNLVFHLYYLDFQPNEYAPVFNVFINNWFCSGVPTVILRQLLHPTTLDLFLTTILFWINCWYILLASLNSTKIKFEFDGKTFLTELILINFSERLILSTIVSFTWFELT